jgi:Protein kinase domain/PEGA domain
VRRAALSALLALALAVPARAEEWFDAYERGLEALKQKKADRAIEMLERAARLRPDPGTNVITYGTNRLERYHPYLRLAEAYLLAGQPARAQEALKRSEARGREPAAERARIAAQVDSALASARAAPTPVPGPVAVPTATAPPATVAQAIEPTAAPSRAAPPSASPSAAAAVTTPARAAPSGILDLRTDPPGATVLLGDRLLGTTPLKMELAAGDYTVTLRKAEAADQSFPVRITGGRTTTENRTLVATAMATPAVPSTPAVASLFLYSDPPGATVYLDDELVGATDPASGRLVRTGVPLGTHHLRLTRAGLGDAVQDVTVSAPGPTTVRAHLTPASPAGSSPIAWALGAVLALVAATAVFLSRRRSAATHDGETVALEARTAPGPGTPGTLLARRATAVSPPTRSDGGPETATLTPPPGLAASDLFGEFRLLEPLGKGGMAAVFKAERRGEVCALKRPLTALLEDPDFLERFLREAEIGRTLHHPNIIRIFERGDVGGVPYFTMELVRGETLHARIRAQGAMDARTATNVVAQVAEALDYAHLKGVIHRDLKPSNIMILEDGTVKVMDYGIARARRFDGLTVTGAFLGTPDYVAPETAEGKGADARSDLYSLGIVFYEILTGQKPFVGDSPFATLRKHVSEPPTPPSLIAPGVPRELEAIILKLLSKSPDDRYPGAEELVIALRDYLNRAA